MTDIETRAKALELAISIYEHHLDILQSKPWKTDYDPTAHQDLPWGTQDILILFRLADAIVPYLKGELEKDIQKLEPLPKM